MKKYILLGFMFVLSIIVLSNGKYDSYAYKPDTSFQQYVDFDVSLLNNVSYIYNADSFYNGIHNNYISIEFLGKQITFNLYQWGYEEDILLDTRTFNISQYFYNYSGVTYKLDDLISDGDLELKLYDIELVYFDESYYDTVADFSFIPVEGGNLLPLIQSSFFRYQFEMYNSIYSFVNYNSFNNGYQQGQQYGYDTAKGEYGYYNGSNWITATVHGSNRYNAGLNENRAYYGKLYEDTWLTAEQYGVIRFGVGYDTGLSTEIDWFEWSTTFFLMPFRIMNIEVLPGVKIGYFALFSLLLGVVGWFFFIVGKGGGRKK